jgi:hypothetical protein
MKFFEDCPQAQKSKHWYSPVSALVLAIFCLLLYSCAGTHGKIKRYILPYSKKEVYFAIKNVFSKYPALKLPDSLSHNAIEYGGFGSWMDADSVSFHFYETETGDEPLIYWCKFSKTADAWEEPSCELSFIGIKRVNGPLKASNELNVNQKTKYIEVFEDRFLGKIQAALDSIAVFK